LQMRDVSQLTSKINWIGLFAVVFVDGTIVIVSYLNAELWQRSVELSRAFPIAMLAVSVAILFSEFVIKRRLIKDFDKELKRRSLPDTPGKALFSVCVVIFTFAASPACLALSLRLMGFGEQWFWPLIAISFVTLLVHRFKESEIKALVETYERVKAEGDSASG